MPCSVDRNAQVAGDLQHRLAGDAGQHGIAQRRRIQHAIAYHENILSRAFADVSVSIERDAFDVAVDDGFHLDELRVHVVGG